MFFCFCLSYAVYNSDREMKHLFIFSSSSFFFFLLFVFSLCSYSKGYANDKLTKQQAYENEGEKIDELGKRKVAGEYS